MMSPSDAVSFVGMRAWLWGEENPGIITDEDEYIDLPGKYCVGAVTWAPSGRKITFTFIPAEDLAEPHINVDFNNVSAFRCDGNLEAIGLDVSGSASYWGVVWAAREAGSPWLNVQCDAADWFISCEEVVLRLPPATTSPGTGAMAV